jgi:dihydrofolate reductase
VQRFLTSWGRRTYDYTNGWKGNHPVNNSVFVVSHSIPKKIPKGATKFTFVTDGIESAVQQALKAAGKKNVYLMGGAKVVQECIKAGLVDEMMIHVVPVLLAEGIHLFEQLGHNKIKLEQAKIIKAPGVTHMKYNFIN